MGCLPDITLKRFLIQGAAQYYIAKAAPRIAGVLELYPKDILMNNKAIGYCRVLAGNDRVSELYPEDILRNLVYQSRVRCSNIICRRAPEPVDSSSYN